MNISKHRGRCDSDSLILLVLKIKVYHQFHFIKNVLPVAHLIISLSYVIYYIQNNSKGMRRKFIERLAFSLIGI